MATEKQRLGLHDLPSLDDFLSRSSSLGTQVADSDFTLGRGKPQFADDFSALAEFNKNPDAWGGLIDQIKSAASMIRETSERHRVREAQVESILTDAQKKLRDAAERIGLAEERAMDAEAQRQEAIASVEQMRHQVEETKRQTEAMVASANARARFAEEQAETALAWLHRVERVIQTEFGNVPVLSGTGRGEVA